MCQEKLNGLIARVGRGEMHIGCWWGHLKERDQLEHLDVDGRIILVWILNIKRWRRTGTGLTWFRIVTSGGLL